MHMVDAKLAEWIELYGKARDVQAQLKAKATRTSRGARPLTQLQAEAERLQRESEAALHALQVEFDALKKERKKH